MPEFTATVSVPWPKHPTLLALEKAILKALSAVGRQLVLQAFRTLEERVFAEGAGAKQRRRRRYLVSRFGEIRFLRWQTRSGEGCGQPVDRALQEVGAGGPVSRR